MTTPRGGPATTEATPIVPSPTPLLSVPAYLRITQRGSADVAVVSATFDTSTVPDELRPIVEHYLSNQNLRIHDARYDPPTTTGNGVVAFNTPASPFVAEPVPTWFDRVRAWFSRVAP